MESTIRRTGVILVTLVLLGTGLWGYLAYTRSHQEPPTGASFVMDPSGTGALHG